MILFKFKETYNIPDFCHQDIVGFRWVCIIKKGLIGLEEQAFWSSGWPSGKGRYYYAYLDKWKFGSHHQYWDGPHCSFHLGFLHFGWSGNWCEKCIY